MWDFHAKFLKLGRSDGAQKLQSGMQAASQASPGCSACRAQGKEAKTRGPGCLKEIEEMNTYAKAKLKLF